MAQQLLEQCACILPTDRQLLRVDKRDVEFCSVNETRTCVTNAASGDEYTEVLYAVLARSTLTAGCARVFGVVPHRVLRVAAPSRHVVDALPLAHVRGGRHRRLRHAPSS